MKVFYSVYISFLGVDRIEAEIHKDAGKFFAKCKTFLVSHYAECDI